MEIRHRFRVSRDFGIPIGLLSLALSGCIPSSPTSESPGTPYPPPSPVLAAIPTDYPPQPIDFTSEQGQFDVTFPCCDLARSALAEFTTVETPYAQSVECNVTVLPEDGASWSVEYCDLPRGLVSNVSTESLLDWARDDVLRDARASTAETHEEAITSIFETKAIGLSITAQANMRGLLVDGTFKARLYIVGNRMYRVSARVYNENWGNRLAMIEPFLDSFFVHTSLTIPFEATPTPP